MRILSIDAATKAMGVAVLEDDKLLAVANLNVGKTHSQRLLPLVADVLKSADLDLKTMDAVAVTVGPGSFTGLRIGIATAKAIATALQLKIIPVKTLDALAFQVKERGCLVCPILDARRNEVYFGIYDEKAQLLEPISAMEPQLLATYLKAKYGEADQRSILFLGDGADIYFKMMATALGGQALLAPAQDRYFMSAAAGFWALNHPQEALLPQEVRAFYLRMSEAEAKRKQADQAKSTSMAVPIADPH